MDCVDVTIVGSGVVGLAVAATLAREDRDVQVLESHIGFGKQVSSRSAGFTHSFAYTHSGDQLKARLTVPGRHRLHDLAERYRIPHLETYLLFVAQEEADIATLELLHKRGSRQGVEDLRVMSKQELRKLQPNVGGAGALYCPGLARFEPHEVMQCYLGIASDRGANLAYRSKVTGVERAGGRYTITITDGNESFSFATRVLVNCAGFGAKKIAKLAGIDVQKAGYRYQLFVNAGFKEQGYTLSRASASSLGNCELHMAKGGGLAKGEQYFKSLTCHRDIDGSFRVGIGEVLIGTPSDQIAGVPKARSYQELEDTDEFDALVQRRTREWAAVPEDEHTRRRRSTHEQLRWLLPSLELGDMGESDVVYAPSPVCRYAAGSYADWTISEESDKGLPGLVNVLGVDSPGFTAALGIADHIENLLIEWLE